MIYILLLLEIIFIILGIIGFQVFLLITFIHFYTEKMNKYARGIKCLVLGYTDTGFIDPYLCTDSHEAFEKVMQTIKTILINYELLPTETNLLNSDEILNWAEKNIQGFFLE